MRLLSVLAGVAVLNLAIIVGMVGGPTIFLQICSQMWQPPLPTFASDLSGSGVLVTGANRGLGRGIAFQLASAGASVTLSGRRVAACEAAAGAIAEELGTAAPDLQSRALDLGDPDSIFAFVREAAERGDKYSAVVLNAAVAGIVPRSKLGINTIFSVNFLGNVLLIDELIRAGVLDEDGGEIVVVSSGAHRMGKPGVFPARDEVSLANAMHLYGQTKYVLQTWFDVLALDRPGLGVYFWNPGPVDTSLGRESIPAVLIPTYKLMKSLFFVSPREVAKTVLFLLSKPRPLQTREYIEMRVKVPPEMGTRQPEQHAFVRDQTQKLLAELGIRSKD